MGRTYMKASNSEDDDNLVSLVEESCEKIIDFTDAEEVEAAFHTMVEQAERSRTDGLSFTNARINTVYTRVTGVERAAVADIAGAKGLFSKLLLILTVMAGVLVFAAIMAEEKIITRLDALESGQHLSAATQGGEDD